MAADNHSSAIVYLPIADAKDALEKKVNILAKISEVGFPKKSRGSDYILVLKVVDHSCMLPGISVNFFAPVVKDLPNVKSVGDVIALHLIQMKNHNGTIYCLFNKKFSSFALYDGHTNKKIQPYQTSSMYREPNHLDQNLLQLMAVSLDQKSNTGLLHSSVLLRNIAVDGTFDIVCKVLHVCKIDRGEHCLLYVWDGTDCPPAKFHKSLDTEKENPTPLFPESSPLAHKILQSFPCEGTVFRIFAYNNFKEISKISSCNCWIKLCNVTCQLQSGLWKGVMKSFSRISMLSDEDNKVKYRQRIYNERCSCKLERFPTSCFPEPAYMTETEHKSAEYATLMDSISQPKVVHKFKCIARVVASYPWRGSDLRSPIDGHYRMRLTLEDPTARVHAYICKQDGEKFFGGNLSTVELNRKMRKLLGLQEDKSSLRNPPWIWCSLKSYYLNKNDPWGSRRYRLFDTWLVD